MPLSKERMREYQRSRRAAMKRGGKESDSRANETLDKCLDRLDNGKVPQLKNKDLGIWTCNCGETADMNTVSSKWRWNGKDWEHYHGYPIGHVQTNHILPVPVDRATLKDDLSNSHDRDVCPQAQGKMPNARVSVSGVREPEASRLEEETSEVVQNCSEQKEKGEGSVGISSKKRDDSKAGNVSTLRSGDSEDRTTRSPSGLRSEAGSHMAMPKMPPCRAPRMNETPSPQDITHTITDIKFEGLKPGYYIFEKEIQKQKDGKDRKCWYCGCAYESRLLLNKFCCPDHKERWLQASLRRGE